MIKEFNDFSNEVGYDIMYYSNDEVTPVTSIDPDSQTIVIFDDFVCEKKIKKTLIISYKGEMKVAQFFTLVSVSLILQRASE